MKQFPKLVVFLLVGALAGQVAVAADGSDATASPAPGRSTSVPLAPNAPSSYVVQHGDTLWAIAGKFLSQPWYWPEVWYLNPDVKNPHRIYPGDTLRLVYDADGRPHIRLERGDLTQGNSTTKLSPQIRATPLEQAIPPIPYEIVAAFMSKPSVLSVDEAKNLPYIVGMGDSHVVAGVNDVAYARGIDGVEAGARYNVVHRGEPITDPDDGALLGYQGIYASTARVERAAGPGADDLAKLRIIESGRETLAGDRVVRDSTDLALDFVPHAPSKPTKGRLISSVAGTSVIGQYSVVAINRGRESGMEQGHVLEVWEMGDAVKDRGPDGAANTNQFTEPFQKTIRLPSEAAGTLMVFKVYDRMSYALVMTAHRQMHIGDVVKNP